MPPKSKKASKAAAAAEAPAPSVLSLLEEDPDEPLADKLRNRGVICTFAQSAKKEHANTRDIQVSNITMTFKGLPMINEAELTLNYGNRYGFIGRNGCGKSTFMEAIGARCFPIPDGIDIFHLREEIEPTELTAMEAVMEVDEERAKLEAESELINDLMSEEKADDEAVERLQQIYDRLDELDAANAEVRASKILTGLGFDEARKKKKTKEFSGGWRMRIALARALFIQPTLLLLDEPTNHLDMEAVVWLEDYLSKWNKILLMVSHSQDFMNNVCTHVMHLQHKTLSYYGGNYDSFVRTRAESEDNQMKRHAKEQEEIAHMKQYIARFGQGNSKMAKQAQSKEKTLEKMMRSGLTDKVETEKALDFKFPDPEMLSPPVLQCIEITFGYPGCEILYSGVDFGVDLDSRVALVGPNGAGKSTLLKIMTGDLMPVAGSVRPHAHLRIAKFSQHFVDVLDLDQPPIDYFRSIWTDMTIQEARSYLGRFGVTGTAQTSLMHTLSDGQKSRVVLAYMAKQNPHVLFLDEPTNHLDMESIDSLAKAINQFKGGMVLVSHDMRLISQVAKEIWMCDNKTITKFTGEIGDFKMHLRKQMQKADIIDGGVKASKAQLLKDKEEYARMFVPLTPFSALSAALADPGAKSLKLAPPVAPAPGDGGFGPAAKTSSFKPIAAPTPAEAAAASKAASQSAKGAYVPPHLRAAAAATATTDGDDDNEEDDSKPKKAVSAAAMGNDLDEGGDDGDEKLSKADEKALIRAKRKAEKEAAKEAARLQDEEREERRLQKLADAEEAMQVLMEKEAATEKWRADKAARQAKEDEQAAAKKKLSDENTARMKAEAKALKLARKNSRLTAEQAARNKMEKEVRADTWTQEQQTRFEGALLGDGAMELGLEKGNRWDVIAAAVGGKTRNQCLARYSFLKRMTRERKQAKGKE